ncbi:hypothetical protein [Austwickia chelonae]|uniref:hypothetical protein n=1 Tax=Austwickia chelonae TaxID=100225 RepID=UPI0011607230|nr:hypothetical protein [Austwickia chelonae]
MSPSRARFSSRSAARRTTWSTARAFRDAARTVGHDVSYREYRGGHDYAWWRHGLTDALDEFGLAAAFLSEVPRSPAPPSHVEGVDRLG